VYVCLCKGIKESDIRKLGRAGVVSPGALVAALGIDEPGCCGQCAGKIQELVALAASALPDAMPSPSPLGTASPSG